MPEGVSAKPMPDILSCNEIEQICTAAAAEGIRKLKITGGEPLVRPECIELVGRLKKISGIEQVTMTTNGVLLGASVEALASKGLDGVNISLDTLNRETYARITGRDALDSVLYGLDCAIRAGLPVKINTVLQKGINDAHWKRMVELARENPVCVRFIEMMPIGYGKTYENISNLFLIQQLQAAYEGVQPDDRVHGNGPAIYYRIPGFAGSIGFISAIHGKFCYRCNRIRLTADGKLKPCLCYGDWVDLGKILRTEKIRGTDGWPVDEQLREAIRYGVLKKPEAHCFEKTEDITENHQMIQIGG
jgi:cyclic pyranopterin phosphate synthase